MKRVGVRATVICGCGLLAACGPKVPDGVNGYVGDRTDSEVTDSLSSVDASCYDHEEPAFLPEDRALHLMTEALIIDADAVTQRRVISGAGVPLVALFDPDHPYLTRDGSEMAVATLDPERGDDVEGTLAVLVPSSIADCASRAGG